MQLQVCIHDYVHERSFSWLGRLVHEGCAKSHVNGLDATVRTQFRWALLLAPLALGANVAFTGALRLTSTASAVTLEQLTSLFIASLSYCILHTRYTTHSLPFLLIAVAGAVMATLGDGGGVDIASGAAPLVGDVISLGVALLAALYMVFFKYAFPSMGVAELIVFLAVKAAVTVGGGWIFILVFDALQWERAGFPTGCAAVWYPVAAIVNSLFNCSLIWATIRLSPLTARLSLLLAIPCSFVLGLLQTGIFKTVSFFGVVLIFTGVCGFEYLSTPIKRNLPSREDVIDP